MCWTFLQDYRIPLDNNIAERDLRSYVIWRKLSFASQSYQGDQFRPLILSIIGTAHKIGILSYHFIRAACEEHMATGKVSTRFVFDPPGLLPQSESVSLAQCLCRERVRLAPGLELFAPYLLDL